MNESSPNLLYRFLFIFYALFVLGSTFSIALAQTALGIATTVFVVVVIKDRHNPFSGRINLVYRMMGVYIVWILFTAFLAKPELGSLLGCREEWLFVAVMIGVLVCQREKWREQLISVFAIGVAAISLYAVVEYFTGTNWLRFQHGRFTPETVVRIPGTFTHYLTFANYYATAGLFLFAYAMFPSGLSMRRLYSILGVAALAMAATVLTSSRTPIAAIIIGLVFCAIVRRGKVRKIAYGLLAALVLVAIFQPGVREKFGEGMSRDTSTTYEGSRIFIWQRSWDIVAKHPIFGVGQGNFRTEYVARLRPDIPEERKHAHAHNDFLNFAAISGIPGALIFMALWGAVLWLIGKAAFSIGLENGRRRAAFAALVGSVVFLMTSITEATFADEEVRELLMFVWAVGLAAWYDWQPHRAAAKVLDTQ